MGAQPYLDFEATTGQQIHLKRVGGRIGEIVFEFCRQNVGRGFHAYELWQFVDSELPVAPDSPRRILSLLAKHGFLTYIVVDRAKSLYQVTEVRR